MKKAIGLAASLVLAAIAAPNLAQAQTAFTTTLVNLRAGPGFDYPVVFPVPENAPVQSYGCLNDWSWCDVSVNGYRGWMDGQYIVYAYENRRVPVYEYGPRYNLPVVTFEFGSYWDRYYRDRPWYRERTRWESYYRDHHDVRRDAEFRNRPRDRDHDGIPDRVDRDRDNDGIANRYDRDRDGDGIPNRYDPTPDGRR